MLVRLNLETRSLHADADRPWLELLDPGLTTTQYMRQLVRAYGFEAPTEAALAYTSHLPALIDLRRRARSGLIAQDLLTLELTPEQVANIPQCMIAPYHSVAEALGWLYVVERSTLLHDAVRRHVNQQLPERANACAYLAAYDGVVSARWEELGETLDHVARTRKVEDQIVGSAHNAFRHARDWFALDRSVRATS